MEKEIAVYTHKQMCKIIEITRSWTLNNPSGPLPYLPTVWVNYISQDANEKASRKTMPRYKKTHWLINILMKLKIF